MRKFGHTQRISASQGRESGAHVSTLLVVSLALILGNGFLTAGTALAREDIVPGSRYVPARAAALGDAYLPIADDPASALFYNPAGLGKLHGMHANLFNLQLYGNTNYFTSINTSHPDFFKVTSLSGYLPALERSPGTRQGVGYSFAPSISIGHFAFGLLAQEQVSGIYNNDGTVSYRSNYQLIPTAGTALRLAEGIVRVGYSVQWVNQAAGEVSSISTSSSDLGYNQGLAKGTALSHTLGFALTLPFRYLPQFDLVARNILTTRFKGGGIMPFAKKSVGLPANDPFTLDASLSMVRKAGMGATFTWVLEDRDFTDRSGVTLLGRLALGMEFDFRRVFFLRAGWGSGYPDLGIGFRRRKSEFSLSWASEEVGNSYHDQRDARLLLQYQVRAF